jgi:hypothetical protein
LSQQDRARICAEFREIQTDLAFEVVEAYQQRRMDDFADALATLNDLAGLYSILCKESVVGQA